MHNSILTNQERRENSMKIRPLQDRIIVKRLEEEQKTKGGNPGYRQRKTD
jgi:hypothetical protein